MANDERDKYTSLNWGVDCTKCVKRGQCSVRGGVAQKCEHGAWNESLGMVLEQARQVDPLFANRVGAAFKRELAAKDAEIVQLRKKLDRFMDVTGDCRKCEECGDESCPWYGEPDGCNNRVARDKFLDGELVDPLKTKDAEIASLRALVKEMADDLSGYLCESECNGACASFGHCCSQTSRQIVAKARVVCHA